MTQFSWDPAQHSVGVEHMDVVHREFLALARVLEDCPNSQFADRLRALVDHTEKHFAAEEREMRETACPSLAEHAAEHARLLADLRRFQQAVERGRPAMARAFVEDGLADWFAIHLATMDSALAAHLRGG
ncbi:MAG: hemerythrin family protein [Rhodocyclaceae bacterium]|nr:hemerythrin family protein [Rhodocyclaceae bacterium]